MLTYSISLLVLFEPCTHHIHASSFPPYILDWTVPGGLPYDVRTSAIGYSADNNTVFILGGKTHSKGLITFDPETEAFTTHSNTYFTSDIKADCQFYAHINNYIYMLFDTSQMLIFDMNTATISYPTFPTPAYDFRYGSACIAGMNVYNNDYLFVLGQGPFHDIAPYTSNKAQIFNLTLFSWLPASNVPNMKTKRSYHACIAHHYGSRRKVYVMSGWDANYNSLRSVEVLDAVELFDNIAIGSTSTSWTTLTDVLSDAHLGPRAMTYYNDIIVFGYDTFNVINTITNKITFIGTSWEILYLGTVLIEVDTILYVFAGSWGYSDLPFPPTKEPTTEPTLEPTKYPTTANPSVSPTNNPSAETLNPSNEPSVSPTSAPSNAPTAAPTRFPTITDAYDSYIDVVYGLRYVSYSNIITLLNDVVNVIHYLERIIERGYNMQENIFLDFSDFWCKILGLNDYKMERIDASTAVKNILSLQTVLSLESRIECNKDQCDHLLLYYNEATFTTLVTQQFRYFFADADAETETLEFYVISMATEASPIHMALEESVIQDVASIINIIFYISLLITCVLIMISIIACCYNDGVCFGSIVDNGRYVAMIIFALHFYDFSSDINLSIEILILSFSATTINTSTLFIIGVVSLLFILVPYSVNLYYAANIKNTIDNNECAESWLNNYSRVFTLLVVLSGGCYGSLVLVSSNIFGLNVFSSGLTRYELKQMAKMKLINLILENVPQLILQLIYAFYMNGISKGVMFAFIASLLSVISTILTYCLDKETHNVKVVKYYLVTECNRFESPSANAAANNDITDDDKANIRMNKGRRRQLSKDMAELFGIQRKNIQIGGVNITKYGFITFIVHYINVADLLSVNDEENAKPQKFITKLYTKLENQINVLFRQHFSLNDDFYVRCEHNLSMRNRVMSVSASVNCDPHQQEGANHIHQQNENQDKEIINTLQKMTNKRKKITTATK